MKIYQKYPELKDTFETLFQTRCDEILSEIMLKDKKYIKLVKERTDASMMLKQVLNDPAVDVLFEQYSDTVYAQEIYELETIYRQAVTDTVDTLLKNKIIIL